MVEKRRPGTQTVVRASGQHYKDTVQAPTVYSCACTMQNREHAPSAKMMAMSIPKYLLLFISNSFLCWGLFAGLAISQRTLRAKVSHAAVP